MPVAILDELLTTHEAALKARSEAGEALRKVEQGEALTPAETQAAKQATKVIKRARDARQRVEKELRATHSDGLDKLGKWMCIAVVLRGTCSAN
ncbi:hypothetical protein WJX72_005864 [[Myrmecia] bisecta]|uniref:Uncharacterized protein n=1 Tax=[Myrmecia] bisecta TaxID=41462 RepID=A0AAW1P3C1_9CHLO